jgi:hypothetical protein
MPRLTTLVLAGALGWPAVTLGQAWGPPKPPNEAPAATRPADPGATAPDSGEASTAPAEKKPEALPPVPPLPPTGPLPASVSAAMPPEAVGVTQKVEELPKPSPAPRAPDVSGMPPMRPGAPVPPPVHPYGHGAMLPGTLSPTIPPVCCPPEPPACTTCNESGFFAYGDLLVLRARQSNPVAVLQRVDEFFFPALINSSVVQWNTDHTGGWRAGGGYLCDNGWLFTCTFTQYKDLVSKQSFTVPDLSLEGATFNVIYVGPGQLSGRAEGDIGSTLTASWNLQLRTVDILVGTVFSPSDSLDLTISAGARLAWLDQDYRTTVFRADFSSDNEHLKLDLRGAGPHIQTEARVYLAPWFALYGRGGTTLLLANRKDDSTLVSADFEFGVNAISRVTYEREEITPVVELAFGGELNCLGGRLLVNVGYEMMYWWELATSFSELPGGREPNHSDISLDGGYLRVTWLF